MFWRSSQDVPALACLDSSVLCHTCFSHQRPALHQMAKIWHPELPYWAINSILFKQSSPADRVRWGFFLKLRVFFYLFYNTWEQYYFSEPPTLSLTSLKCSELFNSNKTIFANSAIYNKLKYSFTQESHGNTFIFLFFIWNQMFCSRTMWNWNRFRSGNTYSFLETPWQF